MIRGMVLLMYRFDFDFVEASFYAELYNVFAAPCSVTGGNLWGISRQSEQSDQSVRFKHRLFHIVKLGGGFKYFLFPPLLGEDSHFD